MTRAAFAFLFLLMMAVASLSAGQTKLVDDVIRMSRAGVSEETIVAFVQTLRDRPAVTADEVIAMKSAGVSDMVIQAMIAEQPARPEHSGSEPPIRNPGDDGAVVRDAPPDSQSAAAGSGGCVVFEPPIPPFYEPPYPSWIWDPNWYQPTLDAKGGTNPMEHHAVTPRPVLDSAVSAIARALGAKPTREKPMRENATPEKPSRDTQDRDSGNRSRGGSRHR